MGPDGNGFYPRWYDNTGETAGKGLLIHMGVVQYPRPIYGTVFSHHIPFVRIMIPARMKFSISYYKHLSLAGNFLR